DSGTATFLSICCSLCTPITWRHYCCPLFPTRRSSDLAEEAMRAGHTKYTPSGGIPELKQAIAEKFQRDNGLTYRPEQIVVTSGRSEAHTSELQSREKLVCRLLLEKKTQEDQLIITHL